MSKNSSVLSQHSHSLGVNNVQVIQIGHYPHEREPRTSGNEFLEHYNRAYFAPTEPKPSNINTTHQQQRQQHNHQYQRSTSTAYINDDYGYGGISNANYEGPSSGSSSPDYQYSTVVYHTRRNNSAGNAFTAPQHGRLTYSWKDICVTVKPSKGPVSFVKNLVKTKCLGSRDQGAMRSKLLKNVNGTVNSGELVCIFGSSGAGKTTLLNTLTFQNGSNVKVNGERYINGEKVNAASLANVSAYVQQQDLFFGTLTVREHLRFQALLRMHANIPYKTRMEKVEQVIDEFGLRKCVDTVIGITGRIKGLSGGEQKRLAFASEILTDPVLMFCDEPTSGLDAFMAQTIVQCLKRQVQKGKAILCTIHQPSSAMFNLFDKVLVMAEGRVAYFGPTTEVIRFLDTQGYPCPQNYNPAEFLTETLAIHPENETQAKATVKAICDGFEKSAGYYEMKNMVENNSDLSTVPLDPRFPMFHLGAYTSTKAASRHYKASWFGQLRAILWRSVISYLKDPFLLKLRFVQAISMALIIGVVFLQQDLNQTNIRNINGAIFLFITVVTYINVFGTLDVFCHELPIFLREHWNGMYRTDVYFLSKIIPELFLSIIFSFMMVAIIYSLVGIIGSVESYLWAVGIMVLISNATTAFGYIQSCLAGTLAVALILAPTFLLPGLIYNGFFMNAGTIPWYAQWCKRGYWLYPGFESLTIIQWRDIGTIPCGGSGTENGNEAMCIGALSGEGNMTGGMVLHHLHFSQDNLQQDIITLALLVVLYQLLAFIALFSKTSRRG